MTRSWDSADRHEGIDPLVPQPRHDLVAAVDGANRAVGALDRVLEGATAIGGAEDRAAEMGDAANRVTIQVDEAAGRIALGLEESVVAVPDSDALPAVVRGADHHRANDGIQPRRITTPRIYGYSHPF